MEPRSEGAQCRRLGRLAEQNAIAILDPGHVAVMVLNRSYVDERSRKCEQNYLSLHAVYFRCFIITLPHNNF